MKIRVINSRHWYRQDEVFDVMCEVSDSYHVQHPDNTWDVTHLVYKTDCEIVKEAEDIVNVTVLRDETVGGLEREYREVKRKAAVGDLVKSCVDDPPIFRVIDTYESGRVDGGADGIPTSYKNYVVLEPTDIVHVPDPDNAACYKRYRLVERKANVGERIVVLDPGTSDHRKGAILTITEVDERLSPGQTRKAGGIPCGWLYEREYRVLETIEDAQPLAVPADDVALIELTRKVNRQAETIERLIDDLGKLALKVAELERKHPQSYVETARGPVNTAPPSFVKPKQSTRDEIVEMAKRDVSELTNRFSSPVASVKFVINRVKRTVVALRYYCGFVDNRGIAKCAPGDVFNTHIGRAIALRRALGLPVPTEYTNAPQPSEPRVGDIVTKTGGVYAGATGSVTAIRPTGFMAYNEGLTFKSDIREEDIWSYIRHVRIIDDSREETPKAGVSV